MPLTASDGAAAEGVRRRGRARAGPSATTAPVGVAPASCGPQTGHALGWAWNRRSAGSSYSAWHAGHIVNPAIVVAGRSYGTLRTIV